MILGTDKMLEVDLTGVINIVTSAMRITSNDYKIYIAKIYLAVNDRSRATTAYRRGMKIVGVGRS